MNLLKESAEFFSSDYNSGTLIYTTTEGLIYNSASHVSPLISDTQSKKYVKFYPSDGRVFTTTDPTGLRIWDAHRRALLYQYKGDILSKHSYSAEYIIAAFDTYNIKFFDLRCRYPINSCKQGNVMDLGWIGSYSLFSYDGDNIKEYDYRSMAMVQNHGSADRFAVSRTSCYFIRRSGNERMLFRVCGEGSNREILSKKVKYGNICGIGEIDAIAYVGEGNVKIEEPGNVLEIRGEKEVESLGNVHIGDSSGFLFANNNLYEFEYKR